MKSFYSKYSTEFSLFFGWYMVMALNLDLTISKQQMVETFKPSVADFLSLFKAHNIEQILVFLFCYVLIKKVFSIISVKPSIGWKNWILYSVPALLFSSFMIVGFSFKTTGLASCITFSKYQFFKTIFAGGGYFILFLCLTVLLFKNLDEISLFDSEPISGSTFHPHPRTCFSCFYRHPFFISCLFLFTFYFLLIIISYPGMLLPDTVRQIFQGYNLSKLNNHHPVLHTLLLHYIIVLGKLIHSYNFGIFLITFFQLSLFISVISFTTMLLIRYFHLKLKYANTILLYFLVHPIVQNNMIVFTKDILFTIFFLLFLLFEWRFFEQNKYSFKCYIMWIIIMLGMVLFRNEGIFIIIPALLTCLCLNVSKKQVGLAVLFIVCFFLTWHHVVFPFFKISEGSIREMLSIPFQQTARYVKYNYQKVTPDEMVAIDAVLDYKTIGKCYNPNVSDPVKDTFKEKSTKEERLRYFKTWAGMFFKEPKLYISTVIANKFQYFYPEANATTFYTFDYSEHCMKEANTNKEILFEFHHLKPLERYRVIYDRTGKGLSAVPIFSVLWHSSTYVWIFILLAFYTLTKGDLKEFSLLIPFFIHLLVQIAGPTNGYTIRYILPEIVAFPFLFIFLMHLRDLRGKNMMNASK